MFKQQRGGALTREEINAAVNSVEFTNWLTQRGFNIAELSKNADDLLPFIQRWYTETEAGSNLVTSTGFKEVTDSPLVYCTTKAECDRFDKEDIKRELLRRGFKEGASSLLRGIDFTPKTTQPELVRLLLASNKREMARKRMIQKHSTRGERSMQGALPSETTNPAMYDHRTGLLKEEYLTQDHHGVVAYDFKGDKHRVEYSPRFNGIPASAKWVEVTKATPGVTAKILRGYYELDSRGLPKINQLNYWQHRGFLHKDKNGDFWQVGCKNRKNKKSKNHGTANCTVNKKTGEVPITWVKYDAENEFVDEAGGVKGKKFMTPMGVYSYDQLMKLNLDDILKMMIVLELMEEGPTYAGKMKELGIGPFDEAKYPTGSALTGRQVKLTKGKKKTNTLVSPQDQALEEALYRQAGLPNCEYPQPPFRCYSDSFIPGTCVPHEEICYKSKYREKWEGAGKLGQNPKLGWAKEASKDATEEITQKDIDEYYREMAEYGSEKENWRQNLIKQRKEALETIAHTKSGVVTLDPRDDISREEDKKGAAFQAAKERLEQQKRFTSKAAGAE